MEAILLISVTAGKSLDSRDLPFELVIKYYDYVAYCSVLKSLLYSTCHSLSLPILRVAVLRL